MSRENAVGSAELARIGLSLREQEALQVDAESLTSEEIALSRDCAESCYRPGRSS